MYQNQPTATIAEKVLNVFSDYRMAPTPIDQYQEIGRAKLAEKISPFIEQGKPINFVILGFPMKSPNYRDKVLGTMPDLAEEVALNNFGTFTDRIAEVYNPGAHVSIVSDGFIFSDIMEVSDTIVQDYENINIHMARGKRITIHDMRDFYSHNLSIAAMREKVTTQFGISETELERRILVDPDVNFLYRGMIRFLSLDLAIKNYPSGNQLHRAAKKLAREMMFRNEAYSALIRDNFSNDVRLSMHPSQNNGNKYSFQLIPSPFADKSPWHCALVIDKNGQYHTMHRMDAMAAGYEIVSRDGQPYYFQEN